MPPTIADPARYLVGLIGAGIGTSLSPALHEGEARAQGLRCFYQLIDIDELGLTAADVGTLLADACRMGFRGVNVTHPCKQAVLDHLDELSPAAAELGAVNTVVFADGKKIGHNTDSSGFGAALARELADAPMRHVVVLGAGGAGSAVAHALLRRGAQQLTIADLEASRSLDLAAALRASFAGARIGVADPGDLAAAVAQADGVINATPAGMGPQSDTPLPPHLLRPEMWVADVVYRPLETELLRHARARACRTLAGSGMLVFQAAGAFRLFTGRVPDTERMFRHLAALTGSHGTAGGGIGVHWPDHEQDDHVPIF